VVVLVVVREVVRDEGGGGEFVRVVMEVLKVC
jgi:hypothetical protein